MTSRWRPPGSSNEEMLPVRELCPVSKADPVRKRVTSSRSQGFQLDSNYWDTKLFNMTWKENKASRSWRGTWNLRVRKGFRNHGVQNPPCTDEGSVAESPREHLGHGTHFYLRSLEWPWACLSGHTLGWFTSCLSLPVAWLCSLPLSDWRGLFHSTLFLSPSPHLPPATLCPTNQTTSTPDAQSTPSICAFICTSPAHPLMQWSSFPGKPAKLRLRHLRPSCTCAWLSLVEQIWPFLCYPYMLQHATDGIDF